MQYGLAGHEVYGYERPICKSLSAFNSVDEIAGLQVKNSRRLEKRLAVHAFDAIVMTGNAPLKPSHL
ncbi:MAG TPA: hypothetical protein DEO56_08860 [Nitrosomonas nitrosa]|nr:hypothetical protein [Nitrosomonas nitrosa]